MYARKQPETIFKEQVKRDLDDLENCWHVKTQQRSIRGTPDILACINGHFVALELKKDSSSPLDKLQFYNLNKILNANGFAWAPTPETWPDILKKIKELCY